MKTENKERQVAGRGEIFYDAECAMCRGGAVRLNRLFVRRGFHWVPMQTEGTVERLGITEDELRREMKVLCADGRLLGGIDSWIHLFGAVWWLWPLAQALRLPGVYHLGDAGYRWVARNRYCLSGQCRLPVKSTSGVGFLDFIGCAVLLLLIGVIMRAAPPWVLMWGLALAMGFGAKWLTWRDARAHGRKPTWPHVVAWFAAWPGLDGRTFFDQQRQPIRVTARESFWAFGSFLAGLALFCGLAPRLVGVNPMAAGWVAMIGVVMIFHFGLFHLLSIVWRGVGIDAQVIMRAPLRSTTLAEFWGTRWNTAFSTAARRLVFRPLTRSFGPNRAAFVVFLVSGLIHEIVITVPARGGFGLPSCYFLLQALAARFQSSDLARRIRVDGGWGGWFFTLSVTAVPAYWLFPPVFVRTVILPMVEAVGF